MASTLRFERTESFGISPSCGSCRAGLDAPGKYRQTFRNRQHDREPASRRVTDRIGHTVMPFASPEAVGAGTAEGELGYEQGACGLSRSFSTFSLSGSWTTFTVEIRWWKYGGGKYVSRDWRDHYRPFCATRYRSDIRFSKHLQVAPRWPIALGWAWRYRSIQSESDLFWWCDRGSPMTP